jgi:hypothetical protein
MLKLNLVHKNGSSRDIELDTSVIFLNDSFVKEDIEKYDSILYAAKPGIHQTIFDVSDVKDYFVFGFGKNNKMNMKNILTGGHQFLLGMHQPYILFIKNNHLSIDERITEFSV